MSGAVASGIIGDAALPRRREAQRGQRTSRTRRLTSGSPMHRHDDSIEVLDPGHRPLRPRPASARPAAARRPPITRRTERDGRATPITADGDRRPRGAADLRRRARPGVHLRRPPAVPVVRAGRARPRRRSCSTSSSARRACTPVRGSKAAARSSPRTRRCGGSPTSSGCPTTAGGVFVSGGTAGNLSALIAARWNWRRRAGGAFDRTRGLIVASAGAHSSVAQAARAMDADVVLVPADERGRLTERRVARHGRRAATRPTVSGCSPSSPPPGTTNVGVVDDLAGVAAVAAELGTWMHVDGAYGGAALAAPSVRHLFDGIERADSFIVDPHKWLFAPFDSCALLYRDPAIARAAHTQHAEYLDVLHAERSRATSRGTPATTPTTCPVGPAACRSGSASRRTAPTPTPRPSRPRCRSRATRPASSTRPPTPSS